MKTLLLLTFFSLLVSCGSQSPEVYSYNLKVPYSSAKKKISAFNKSSETNFGWTTNEVKFEQHETNVGSRFVFTRKEAAPDLGVFPVFEGVLTKQGRGSKLVLTEQSSHNIGYVDVKPFYKGIGDGPDRWMAKYDEWVRSSLPATRRSVTGPGQTSQ